MQTLSSNPFTAPFAAPMPPDANASGGDWLCTIVALTLPLLLLWFLHLVGALLREAHTEHDARGTLCR